MTSSLTELFFHHVYQRPDAPFLTDAAARESLSYSAAARRING